jgi:hypothetical protein
MARRGVMAARRKKASAGESGVTGGVASQHLSARRFSLSKQSKAES